MKINKKGNRCKKDNFVTFPLIKPHVFFLSRLVNSFAKSIYAIGSTCPEDSFDGRTHSGEHEGVEGTHVGGHGEVSAHAPAPPSGVVPASLVLTQVEAFVADPSEGRRAGGSGGTTVKE